MLASRRENNSAARLRARLWVNSLEGRVAPAVFTVNSLTDTGTGTGLVGDLRYCINQANALTGDDEINITATGVITLAMGQFTLSDPTGKTTITGPGANLLTIDANLKSRVFEIKNGVTAEITGLTATRGRVGSHGGGVNNAGTLTIMNSIFSGNTAIGTGANGGGINNSGTLTVINATLSGNSANGFSGSAGGNGGGINNSGTLTVTNSTLTGNSSHVFSGSVGGGGGINNTGTLTVTNAELYANSVTGTNAKGGGINNSGVLTLTNAKLSGNSARSGGGINNSGTSSASTIANSSLVGNTGSVGGGGLSNFGTIAVSDSNINGNLGGSGGGIDNSGTLAILDSSINGNTGSTLSNGGGIRNYGTLTISNATFSGNFGTFGAGICNIGIITMSGSSISGNYSAGVGLGAGGGVYNSVGSTITITHSTINGNSTQNGLGGGLYSRGTLAIANASISGNFASFGGGGLICSGSTAINNTRISGNTSPRSGAGIANYGQAVIAYSQVTGNTVGGNDGGGGIRNGRDATLVFSYSEVSGNSARAGGGIYNDLSGNATIINSTISNNTSATSGGGISNRGTLAIISSTISGNSAGSFGGGVVNYFNPGTQHVTNSIVAGNKAPLGSDQAGSLATNVNNLINMSAAAAGLGTLGNYGGPTQTIPLLRSSPAIDAGSATTITMDQRGLPRFGTPDIGAFESQGFKLTTSGSGQSAPPNTPFAKPLVVTVTANNPVEPVDGGVVTFTPPAFGASASLSASTVAVMGGKASVTAIANGTAGKYQVIAKSGLLMTSFVLTNAGPPNVVSQSFVGGNLSVSFGNQGNDIEVFGQTGAVTVRSNGTVVGTYAVTGIVTVGGGTGNDTVTITVNSGAAFPSLVTVNAGGGSDVIQIGSSATTPGTIPNLTLNLADGNNQVIDKGVNITNSWNITAASGNDSFLLSSPVANSLSITAGDGNNTASIFSKVGNQILYKGGSGIDNVTVGGVNNYGLYVFLGAGKDTFTFAAGTSIGRGLIDFGADNDTYIPNGVFVGSSLTLLNL